MVYSKERCFNVALRLAIQKLHNCLTDNPEVVNINGSEDLLSHAYLPAAWAMLARRLWARGHDIEGVKCPRIAYRLTHKALIG